MLSAKRVNDTCNGRSFTLADEVEVEHALHGSCLESAVLLSALHSHHLSPSSRWMDSLHETSRFGVEKCVRRSWAQRAAGRNESLDVVVGREAWLRSEFAIEIAVGGAVWLQ